MSPWASTNRAVAAGGVLLEHTGVGDAELLGQM